MSYTDIYNPPIIVLGMIKSGASEVAGTLIELGVNMGNNLSKDFLGEYNEDKDISKLNMNILLDSGGSWLVPPNFAQTNVGVQKYLKDIEDLIREREELNKNKFWGIKDVEMVYTIPFYMPFFKVKPKFIVCYNNFDIILRNLNRNYGIDMPTAYKLIDYCYYRIEKFFEMNKDLKKIILINYGNENEIKKNKKIIEKFIYSDKSVNV